jgi:hypothetical protein
LCYLSLSNQRRTIDVRFDALTPTIGEALSSRQTIVGDVHDRLNDPRGPPSEGPKARKPLMHASDLVPFGVPLTGDPITDVVYDVGSSIIDAGPASGTPLSAPTGATEGGDLLTKQATPLCPYGLTRGAAASTSSSPYGHTGGTSQDGCGRPYGR